MNTTDKPNPTHDSETGSEQGLRSGSTAGDSHGETVGAPSAKEGNDSDEKGPGERRKELLEEQ